MEFVGNGQRLSNADYAAAARDFGLKVATIKGVVDIEAAGSGFDSANRPKILTEPHIFYRHLTGAKRAAAVAQGIAYPHWGEKPYPHTSQGNYDRLLLMIAVDETAALMSASWGLTQILGENFAAAGFASPQAMVEAYKEGEDDQLHAFLVLVSAWGLIDELQRRDAAGFAKAYNGAGYARNRYDAKLRAAWAMRDREPVPKATAPDGPPAAAPDAVPLDHREPPPPVKPAPVPPSVVHGGVAVAAGGAVVAAANGWPWWVLGAFAVAAVAGVIAVSYLRKHRT